MEVPRIFSPRFQRVASTELKPSAEATSQASVASEAYVGGVEAIETIRLPRLVEPAPEDLKRGYLWNAVPLPGPIDAIVGAVVGFGPIPEWLGLEPVPKGIPNPQPLGFSWNQAGDQAFGQQARRLEGLLRDPEATEVGKRPVKGGSNANYLVTLSNGVSAMWTPSAQEKSPKDSRPNIPAGTQAKREEAAYLVDRHLGHLGRVPPAVSSGLEGRSGSLKFLVTQGTDQKDGQIPEFSTKDYRRMALFDHVIGNLDRHTGNFLVDQNERPIPIDHGLAFPTKNESQGFSNFHFGATFQFDDKEKATLKKFVADRAKVTEDLKGLLEPEAIEAMYQRVDTMLQTGWVSHQWRS
jgi:Phosphatidylinositol 3- and 4-kinase